MAARRRLARLVRHVRRSGSDESCEGVGMAVTAATAATAAFTGLELTGKRAVVTGSASGIDVLMSWFGGTPALVVAGKATAELMAARGASVVCCDISDDVNAVVEDIVASGGTACGLVCDLSKESAAGDAVALCVERYGGLDIMFANAGVSGTMTPMLEQDSDEWNAVLRINVLGAFWCLQAAARRMKEQGTGGSIVLTASVAGIRAGAGGTPYSASKAAVNSLGQTAAWGLYKSGIRVNTVCPGLIRTGMTELLFMAAEARGKGHLIGQLNPVGRAGSPAEIAQVVAFLASDAASYVNGQAIAVDGGLSASHPISKPGRVA